MAAFDERGDVITPLKSVHPLVNPMGVDDFVVVRATNPLRSIEGSRVDDLYALVGANRNKGIAAASALAAGASELTFATTAGASVLATTAGASALVTGTTIAAGVAAGVATVGVAVLALFSPTPEEAETYVDENGFTCLTEDKPLPTTKPSVFSTFAGAASFAKLFGRSSTNPLEEFEFEMIEIPSDSEQEENRRQLSTTGI